MADERSRRRGRAARRWGGRRLATPSEPKGSGSPKLPWWDRFLPAGPCPDADTYLALLKTTLPPDERDRVVRHITRCRRCTADFKYAAPRLIEIIREGEEQVDSRETAPALPRLERLDSHRLRALVPGIESADTHALVRRALERPEIAVEETPTTARPHEHSRRPTLAVVGVALLIGALFRTHLPGPESSGPSGNAPTQRVVSPRFTGGRPWTPLVRTWPHLWREQVPVTSVTPDVAAAERRRGTLYGPTVAELAAAGVTYALGGHGDSAVEFLRRAAAAEPDSPELLSDLGAALLARVEIGERRRQQQPGAELEDYDADLPAALEAIERALELAPEMPEALFNRALALERLYLRRSAREAWQAYLDVDDRTSWAREAQDRMEAIVVPVRPDPRQIRAEIAGAAAGGDGERVSRLVETQRHLARMSVTEDLLPQWAEAWLDGDHEQAERLLGEAGVVADEWEAQTAETVLREAVAEVKGATGEARNRLAEGYRDLGRASRAFADFEIDAAAAFARRSLNALPAKSRAFTWAMLVKLACDTYPGQDIEAAALRLDKEMRGDLASHARVNWLSGLQLARRGRLAAGLRHYEESLTAYERLDDFESTVWLHHLIGEVNCHMGASGACWKHRRIALEGSARLLHPWRAMTILRLSAMLAQAQGMPWVAGDLLGEALREDGSDSYEIASTLLWRSRVLRDLGRDSASGRDLQLAMAWAMRTRGFDRRDLDAQIDLASGLAATDPQRAIARLSRAIARFRALDSAWRVPDVLLARARVHLQAGDEAAAETDLSQGLALLRGQRSEPIGQLSSQRSATFDALLDERVGLALRQGRSDDAFAIAGEGRALPHGRYVGDAEVASRLPRPGDIAAQLDPETTLLVYSWLPDAVRVWRIERAEVSLVSLESAPRQLAPLIAAFTADLRAESWTEATRATAMRIYQSLWQPVQPTTRRVVIVPDGELLGLPFAALIDSTSGRFLVEDVELMIAGSAPDLLRSRASGGARPEVLSDALVVGDPSTSATLFPEIRPLPGARVEARAVAALYRRRELLLGKAATRSAFLAAVGRRQVIHFSGHALSSRVSPERSSLPLAEETGDPGLLAAAEIARLDLSRTRVVVLSGCETGVEESDGAASSLSLARAFLVAGVPDVVASLWPIADVPSAPLMTAFHQRLRQGESPASALRRAQLILLRGRDSAQRSPAVWAAFEAFSR